MKRTEANSAGPLRSNTSIKLGGSSSLHQINKHKQLDSFKGMAYFNGEGLLSSLS